LSQTKTDKQADLEIKQYRELAAIATGDFWYFWRYFVRTLDSHDARTSKKVVPARALDRIFCRVVQEIPDVLFTEKSRQVMMTWRMAAFMLWDTIFHRNRLNIIQSKKDEDAQDVVDRCRHIYDCLTEIWPLDLPQPKRVAGQSGTADEIYFPSIFSRLRGIPMGPDILRMHTCTNIFSDEINHQTKAEDSYGAAAPTLSGGGRYFAQGTPNGHTFAWETLYAIDPFTGKPKGPNLKDSREILDPPFKAPEGLSAEAARWWIEKKILDMSHAEFWGYPLEVLLSAMPGMEYWQTVDETHCLRIHYSADPMKSPETEAGREWIKAEKKRIKSQERWMREYEISYDTFEGLPVIHNWSEESHVRAKKYDKRYGLVNGVDFGVGFAVAFLCQFVEFEDFNAKQLRFLDEVIKTNSNTYALADRIVEVIKGRYPEAWDYNDIRNYVDPAGHQQRETTSDKDLNTSIKIMQSRGLRCYSRKLGLSDSTEFMIGQFCEVLPNGEPSIVFHPRCEYGIKVFGGGLHWPTHASGDRMRGVHEGKYEKDGTYDHGGDAGRHVICNTFRYIPNVSGQKAFKMRTKKIRQRGTGRTIGIVRQRW